MILKQHPHALKVAFCLTIVSSIFIYNGLNNRHHLPFLEAAGYLDTMSGTGLVRWLSNDKVIYGVNSNEMKDSYSGVDKLHLESSKQVNIFDIKNQKSYLYKSGQLMEYKNGQILIRLSLGNYDHINNLDTSKPKYLYGYLGSETLEEPEKRPTILPSPHLDKCPSDNTDSKPYLAWLLGSEYPNACLRLPDLYDKDRRWIYYPATGNAIELITSSKMFIPEFTWINWMKAYLLDNTFNGGAKTVILLYPDGKLKTIYINQSVKHAKPTKMGVIGVTDNKLVLFYEKSVYQIAKGKIYLTEISPDGCKVAYVTNAKLRVINVCKFK
ncbi:hypothetical protein ACG94X_12975 [Acinetobacter sp. ULE_I010]|uniref:hypothetical protein n=1 Tax=Acinetobacter sp. ULE_I010 TaxID=3373065 RepID=UPI003AF77BFA